MQAAPPRTPNAAREQVEATLPRVLLLACIAYPWLNPLAAGPSTSVQPWLVSVACAALLLAVRGWVAPRFPAALWIAVLAFATVVRSLPSLDAIAALGGLVLVVCMAGTVARDDEAVRTIAAAWLIAATVSSVIALAQYFNASDALAPFVSHATAGEAYGNLRQRNQLATLMAIGFAALLWFVRQGWTLQRAAAPLVLLAAGSAASASRTGAVEWIALAFCAMGWAGPHRRRIATLAGMALIAYAACAVALPSLLHAATGLEGLSVFARFAGEDGCASRRVLWSNVAHLIAQHPWAGWGWGELDYAHYMTLYSGVRFCDILDNAHSLPLHLAVELGIPVAIVACAGLVYAFVRLAPWRESDPARQLALGVALAILLHSLLEYPLWYGPFQMAFGLALGLLWPRPGAVLTPRRANLSSVAAAAMLAAVTYAGWDYHRISQVYMAPEARDAAYRDDPLPLLRASWLFRAHVEFAELTVTPLTRANARWTYETALAMLHYSPEPRVIEKLIESASLLGERDVAVAQLARFRAAFPREHAQWAREQGAGRALRSAFTD